MNIEKTKEQETLKYLNAMGIIDFNKLGFVYGKETITDTLVLLKNKDIEIAMQKDNYKMLSESVSGIAKELNLEEDATIDEIYVAIRLLKSKRVNMFEQLECIEKKNKIIGEMARIMQQILVSTEFIKKQWWKRICKCRKDADLVNCSGKLCEDCVKEYFTKKVEDK